MKTVEKVGDVLRKPFGALKRICEENSTTAIIGGGILRNYEKIVDIRVNEKGKDEVASIVTNNNRSLFDEKTVEKYASLGEEMLGELKEEELEIGS